MNFMFEHIDLYCERLDAGFWAEPINALTNLAFLLAAWLVWRRARKLEVRSYDTGILAGMIVLIGIGSFLFHTFATGWAMIADDAPILIFQLIYLYFYLRRIVRMNVFVIAGLLIIYFLIALQSGKFSHLMNGSLIYAPAFTVILILGAYHYFKQPHARLTLLTAAGAFLLSVSFRTLDMAVCPFFSIGTHFMWHLLNALVLYLLMRGYMANLSQSPPTPS